MILCRCSLKHTSLRKDYIIKLIEIECLETSLALGFLGKSILTEYVMYTEV